MGDLSTRWAGRDREQTKALTPGWLIGTDESQPAIPWRVGLHQSPPPLHRLSSECCTVVLPVERFAANGEQCLNWLCQPRGQAHNIPLSFPPDLEAKDALATKKSLIEQAVVTVLENLRPLILLDGLDEVSHKLRRDSIVKGIRRLAMQLENARMILTARTGEFTYHIEKMTAYEIAPLSKQQISMFAIGWLGAGEATGFLSQVEHSPFADTAIKPLTLAHLCAIFERVHRIPEKPKSVYKKIVSLLLEDWDQQRSVQRVSSYLNYAQILAQLR